MTDALKLATREVQAMLDDLVSSRSRLGEFDREEFVPDIKDMLKRAIEDDSMIADEILEDAARRIGRDYFRSKAPSVPEDPNQLALFYQPDALLTLGEREYILMADAEAIQIERHRTVLTRNFQAQSSAYFGWMGYIDDRLPLLRARGCDLAALEAELGADEAA